MTLKSIVARSWWLLTRLPTARMYWKQHGFRALLVESFDILVRHPLQESVSNANRWKGDAAFTRVESKTDSRPLAKPLVLIIANLNLPQCRKYRVIQKIEQLQRTHGIEVAISSYTDVPRVYDQMQLATSVLFYRVPDGDLFQAFLKEAKRLGSTTCYDIDDPIFSEPILKSNANLKAIARQEADNIINDAANYLSAMQKCDICTVSTPGLVAAASEAISVPVYLWRNAIDDQSSQIASDLLQNSAKISDGNITLAYMSGSHAHELDFEYIEPALARILDEHANVNLDIMGHVRVRSNLAPYRDRINYKPFSSYRFYFQNLLEADLTVIPLLDDPFNACKSAIRLLEASTLATPCVVSPVGDFANITEHGVTAMVADNPESWIKALDDLITDERLRNHIGWQSQKELSRLYGSSVIAGSLSPDVIEILRGKAA